LIVIIVVIEATALLTRNRGNFFQPKESNNTILVNFKHFKRKEKILFGKFIIVILYFTE